MSIGKKLAPLAVLLTAGCALDASGAEVQAASAACAHRPTPVVFDTDMDFDDAAALAYLCAEHQSGHIALRAVTIENGGAGLPGSAIRHARCVLDACGLAGVPIADGPAVGPHAAAPELRGAVELVLEGALAGCTASSAPSEIDAPTLLRTALEAEGDAVLLTTGPLTNVAAAFGSRHGREASENVARAVVMAGTIASPGNLLGSGTETYDGTQEVNAWLDPGALAAVLTRLSGRVTLVPLDATNDVPVTPAFLAQLDGDATTPSAQVVVDITSQPIVQFGVSIHAFYWWDPLAAVTAVAAVGGAQVVTTDRARLSVITEEGPSSGRIVRARRGTPVSLAVHADAAAFEAAFLGGLNQRD
jgi:purine nucleosidase